MRNQSFKIKQSLWKEKLNALYPLLIPTRQVDNLASFWRRAIVKGEIFVEILVSQLSYSWKKYEMSSLPNFAPPGLRPFDRLFLFQLFRHSESTKWNSVWKVLGGKVRNFSPTKIYGRLETSCDYLLFFAVEFDWREKLAEPCRSDDEARFETLRWTQLNQTVPINVTRSPWQIKVDQSRHHQKCYDTPYTNGFWSSNSLLFQLRQR